MRRIRESWSVVSIVSVAFAVACAACGGDGGVPTVVHRTPSELATERVWTFEGGTAEQLPQGATVLAGSWVLRAEGGATPASNALCQTGVSEYPALVLTSDAYGDLSVTTRFKTISGEEDRAAGLDRAGPGREQLLHPPCECAGG